MAEGAIIFLLKVVYFSIERWCTFGLTNTLNILLGVLVTWNSRYLEKVQKKVKDEEWYDEESFKRISPLGTRHVNFLGKYVFNEDKVKTEDGLRDLYLKK